MSLRDQGVGPGGADGAVLERRLAWPSSWARSSSTVPGTARHGEGDAEASSSRGIRLHPRARASEGDEEQSRHFLGGLLHPDQLGGGIVAMSKRRAGGVVLSDHRRDGRGRDAAAAGGATP